MYKKKKNFDYKRVKGGYKKMHIKLDRGELEESFKLIQNYKMMEDNPVRYLENLDILMYNLQFMKMDEISELSHYINGADEEDTWFSTPIMWVYYLLGIYHDDKENVSNNVCSEIVISDFFGRESSLKVDLAINITKRLLILGADVNIPNYYGESLIDVIRGNIVEHDLSKQYTEEDKKYFSYIETMIESRFE